MSMITQEQSEFLKKEGYLLVDVLSLMPDEFYEAEQVLNEYIDNKSFDTLVCNPYQWELELDDVLKMFPNVERKKMDEFTGPQDSLVEYHNWIVENYGDNPQFNQQIWLYKQHKDLFNAFKKNIAKDVYDVKDDELHYIGNTIAEFTLYIPGSRTPLHQDGCQSGRMCVILTYLSKDWKEDDGGLFKFTDIHGNIQEIKPEYGKSLILDFTDKFNNERNNLFHEVTLVENNFWRYTHLDSVNSWTFGN